MTARDRRGIEARKTVSTLISPKFDPEPIEDVSARGKVSDLGWSASGDTLAWASGGRVRIFNFDGANLWHDSDIGNGSDAFMWHPKEDKIAFHSHDQRERRALQAYTLNSTSTREIETILRASTVCRRWTREYWSDDRYDGIFTRWLERDITVHNVTVRDIAYRTEQA